MDSPDAKPLRHAGSPQRARGEVRARFERTGARTALARLYQSGGLRLASPNSGAQAEAVLINTGGGMTGGDRAEIEIALGAGAQATLTTQSAEKIYRGDVDSVRIETRIAAAAGASLEWLPQETIVFDSARLARRLQVELDADATLLMVEAFTFGRTAYGEDRIDATLRDSWRIRREGRLIFAEEMRLENSRAALARPALGGGARAMASLVWATPDADALDRIRAAFAASAPDEGLEWGASRIGELAIARALSPAPSILRAAIAGTLRTLRGRAAPRVWG